MTALSMMLLKGVWHWGEIGEVLLWVAGVLTFVTGYQYFQKSLDYICETEKCAKIPPIPKINLPNLKVAKVKEQAKKVSAKIGKKVSKAKSVKKRSK